MVMVTKTYLTSQKMPSISWRKTETVSWLLDKHEQLNSQILICKNVKKHLEEKVAKLEKAQAMSEQYTRKNNIELTGILNSIRDNVLEETIIAIVSTHPHQASVTRILESSTTCQNIYPFNRISAQWVMNIQRRFFCKSNWNLGNCLPKLQSHLPNR